MKHRFIGMATTTLVTGALLISCSSKSENNDDAIEGVKSGEKHQNHEDGASASPEMTSSDGGVERPEIELPDDMNNVFEETESGNELQDAVVRDVIERINAIDMAISQSNPELSAVEFYHFDQALVDVRGYIRGAADANDTWTGTVRFYDFTIDASEDGDATASYCVDTSERRTKELDTGDVLPLDDDARVFNFVQLVLDRNDAGVWQVSRIMPRDEELDGGCAR